MNQEYTINLGTTSPRDIFAQRLRDNLTFFPKKEKPIRHPRLHAFTARRKQQMGRLIWKIEDHVNEDPSKRIAMVKQSPQAHEEVFAYEFSKALRSIFEKKHINRQVLQAGFLTADFIPIPMVGTAVTLFGINIPNTRRAYKEGNRKKAGLYLTLTSINFFLGILGITSLIPFIGQILGIGFLAAGLSTTTLFYDVGNQAYDFAFQKDLFGLAHTILASGNNTSEEFATVTKTLTSSIEKVRHHYTGSLSEAMQEKQRQLEIELAGLTKQRSDAVNIYRRGNPLQKSNAIRALAVNGIKRIDVQHKLDTIDQLTPLIQLL